MRPGLDKIDVIKISNSTVQMFWLKNFKCYLFSVMNPCLSNSESIHN